MSLYKIYPFFIALCIALSGFIALKTGNSFIEGAMAGLIVSFVPLLLLGVTVALMHWWRPERPACICGRSKAGDYEYIDRHSGTRAQDGDYYYRCPNCKREYRLKRGKFDVKTDEGFSAYMEISKWKIWVKTRPPAP